MKKTLIAYFTRTGITKKLAEDTAKQTGADLFAIALIWKPKTAKTKHSLLPVNAK